MAEFEDKNNINIIDNDKNTNVNVIVKEWLATYFETSNDNISDMLKTQNATVYLLIWPIMEKDCFNGFMTVDKIDEYSEILGPYYDKLNMDEITHNFYDRYQNPIFLINLFIKQGHHYRQVKKLLSVNYNELSDKDKVYFMLSVVYRFRNNIFHGSKAIDDWRNYSKEIEKCIIYMMAVVDCYKNYCV